MKNFEKNIKTLTRTPNMSYIQKKLELAKICDDLINDFQNFAASTKAFKESVNYNSNDRTEFDNIDDDSQMPSFWMNKMDNIKKWQALYNDIFNENRE